MSKLTEPRTSRSTSKPGSGDKRKTNSLSKPSKKFILPANPSNNTERNFKDAYKYEVEFSVVITKTHDCILDYHKRMVVDPDAYGRHRVETVDRTIDYDNRSIFVSSLAQIAERTVTQGSVIGHYPTKEINISLDATTTELILKLMGLVTDPPEDQDGAPSTPEEPDKEDAELKTIRKKLKAGHKEFAHKQRGRPRKGS